MAQRFSLDPQSFEQFLAAASLLQQFQRQATQSSGAQNFAYHLLELLDTQKAIESGALDTDTAINRIVRLALRVLGAEGTAAWLFSNDEFIYRAGSGRSASKDERLRLTVLARVAAICEPSRESFPGHREWAKGAGDSGYYPGCVRSLIVGPIYQHDRVVGALAGFSTAFDAFDERDAANIRLLSGLIGTAMERAVVPDISVAALPRQTLLRVIEHIVPALEQLVHEQDSARYGTVPEPIIHEEPEAKVASQQSPLEVSSFAAETETGPQPIRAGERIEEFEDVSADAVALPAEPIVAVRSVQEEPAPLMQSAATSPEEQHPVVVKAVALRDELAELSRSIAEMVEDRESASADLAAANVVAPEVQDPTPVPLQAVHLETNSGQDPFSSATPVQATVPADETADVQPFTPMDDTAVPGIGVRAALYDDEEEQPSRLWQSIRNSAASSARALTNLAGNTFRSMQRSASWTASSGRQFGSQVREKAQFRFTMKLPTERLSEATRRAQARVSNQATNARARMQGLTSRRLALPKISTAKARNIANQTSTSLRKAATSVAETFKALVNSLPNLPSFSGNSIRAARPSSAVAEQRTESRVNRFQNFRLRVHVNGTTLRRSASALAILLVMSAFLVMESGLFRSDSTAAASARNEMPVAGSAKQAAAERTISSNATMQNSNVATDRAPARTGPTSHLLITDPSTEDIVQNLTRFEVSTVRRQAATGDEEAAFQLGMMYEIGYNVKQNCSKAAEWVAKAASAGYPPAQYNLGLRYKDGDGVPASTAEAEKWLNKAAAGKYRPARVALAKLLPQER